MDLSDVEESDCDVTPKSKKRKSRPQASAPLPPVPVFTPPPVPDFTPPPVPVFALPPVPVADIGIAEEIGVNIII